LTHDRRLADAFQQLAEAASDDEQKYDLGDEDAFAGTAHAGRPARFGGERRHRRSNQHQAESKEEAKALLYVNVRVHEIPPPV
ncbi:MAG: hypothetical protein J0H60_17620, partial [Rhizobiales bacterium]|nr:hypothetical protein [Hyphomicrobiales bacterium]